MTTMVNMSSSHHVTKPKRRLSNRVASNPASPSFNHAIPRNSNVDESTATSTASSFTPTSPIAHFNGLPSPSRYDVVVGDHHNDVGRQAAAAPPRKLSNGSKPQKSTHGFQAGVAASSSSAAPSSSSSHQRTSSGSHHHYMNGHGHYYPSSSSSSTMTGNGSNLYSSTQPAISEEDSRRGSGSSSDRSSSSTFERPNVGIFMTTPGGSNHSSATAAANKKKLQAGFEFSPPLSTLRPPPAMAFDYSRRGDEEKGPMKVFGIELKWISLVTLALQNAFLTIIMHYSRISTAPSKTYSAASAVLMNELLKGSISLLIALKRIDNEMTKQEAHLLSPMHQMSTLATYPGDEKSTHVASSTSSSSRQARAGDRNAISPPATSPIEIAAQFSQAYFKPDRWRRLASDIFSRDCWKLSIPAVLYVIQNNLQYVAASNLDVATFQVTYQMKILTTAFFSVVMLGKKLTTSKWLSLLLLAVGVGIVQIQSGKAGHEPAPTTQIAQAVNDIVAEGAHRVNALRSEIPQAADVVEFAHKMSPLTGFSAVSAACMTSGLAGVYFEMVLKGSKADLWTRNVQLSLFSLVPAVLPILFGGSSGILEPFRNFSLWAWGTVLTQVLGGLITAIVIKYSDNILKGFATSLSIVISFLASVGLFAYPITPAFVLGSIVVLAATWMYNQPPSSGSRTFAGVVASATGRQRQPTPVKSRVGVAVPGSPIGDDAPIIGETPRPSRTNSMVSLLGLNPSSNSRAGTPSLPDRSSSPATNTGFFTAPTSPYTSHAPTPISLSTHPSSSSLYDAASGRMHANGSSSSAGGRGGGPLERPISLDRIGSSESMRKHHLLAKAHRPLLEVDTGRAGT